MKDIFDVMDWPYRKMKFDKIIEKVFDSELIKTRIAFLDTGCNSNLEAIKRLNITEQKISMEQNFIDVVGHGTCFASILGQYVACEGGSAQITSIKIGNSPQMHINGIIEGLEICLKEKYDVINIGISNCSYNHKVANLIRKIVEAGTIVIAPSGNNVSGIYTYPASLDTVINCGARDRNNQIVDFSNRNDKIDFYVPGVDIKANTKQGQLCLFKDCIIGEDGWSLVKGTSFAAAIMTAFATLVKAYDRSITYKQLKIAFQKSDAVHSDFYEVFKNIPANVDADKIISNHKYYEINHPSDYDINGKWSITVYDCLGKMMKGNYNEKVRVALLKKPFDSQQLDEIVVEYKGEAADFSFNVKTCGCLYIKASSSEGRNTTLCMALNRPKVPKVVLEKEKDIRISVEKCEENIEILYAFDDNSIQMMPDGSLGANTKMYMEPFVIEKEKHKRICFAAFQNGTFSNMVVKNIGKD